MSLLELQKFLLEYQRVSSAQAVGRDNGVGTGDIRGAVLLAVGLGWLGCVLLCLAQLILLEQEVL